MILGFFTLCNFKNVLYVILHIHHAVGLACKLLMTIALSCFIWILMTLQLEWILFDVNMIIYCFSGQLWTLSI